MLQGRKAVWVQWWRVRCGAGWWVVGWLGKKGDAASWGRCWCSPRCWTGGSTGAMATAGCSCPRGHCAWQTLQVKQHTLWCASPSMVEATQQVFIFHFLRSHLWVPFRLPWSKIFFCPYVTSAPSMFHVIDCLVLQVFQHKILLWYSLKVWGFFLCWTESYTSVQLGL